MNKSHPIGWAPDSPTPAQIKEFFAQIERGRITKEHLQVFLMGGGKIKELCWQEFYLNVFDIEIDLSYVTIPGRKKGFDRLIVVVPGMTSQRLYDKCEELFPSWKWTDEALNDIVHSDRRTSDNSPYVIWVRDRVEADEELKNLSANDLKKKGVSGITLEERLLVELKYFQESGEHLDVNSVTLCSGSCYGDGDVPSVFWSGGRLGVNWCSSGIASDNLRSRQVVS